MQTFSLIVWYLKYSDQWQEMILIFSLLCHRYYNEVYLYILLCECFKFHYISQEKCLWVTYWEERLLHLQPFLNKDLIHCQRRKSLLSHHFPMCILKRYVGVYCRCRNIMWNALSLSLSLSLFLDLKFVVDFHLFLYLYFSTSQLFLHVVSNCRSSVG